MTVRMRAMLLVIILMLSLSAIFLFAGNYFNEKYLDYSFRRFDSQLARSFGLSVSETERKYFNAAHALLQRDKVLSAFLAGDREKLFLELVPLYREMTREDPFFHVMHFIDKNGVTVLRMHRPDFHGDNLTDVRPLVRLMNRTRERLSGFEPGRHGIYYRVMIPIFSGGEYEGMLDLGLNADFVIEAVSKHFQFKSALFLNKSYAGVINNREEMIGAGNYYITGTDDPVFLTLGTDFTPGREMLLKKIDGAYYSFHTAYELREYDDAPFAYLVVVQNIDAEVQDYRNARFYLVLVVFAFLILAAAILHYSFRVMLREIEEGKKTLSAQQRTDTLTGLPNRNALLSDLEWASGSVMILINIDRFKEVNEVFGIGAGDQVLKEYSVCLREYISSFESINPEITGEHTLYRLGRDEFVILLNTKTELAEKIADYISNRTDSEIIDYQGIEISISVSIGISGNREKPLQSSDIALKISRERKRAYMHFDESMELSQHQSNNFFWLNKVKQAIKEDRIVPYFQGIMDNRTGEIRKYECLIRMLEADGSVVSPGMFLPIIKKTKLYPQLTKIMLRKSVEHFNGGGKEFSINISTEDILNKDIVHYIQNLLKETCTARNVIFEILETDNIGNYEEIREFISEVKSLGCKVAIDDFGTGYSNFTHLMNLDFDYLKIDGSLIQNIHRDEYTNRLVKSIAGFAGGMKIETVAEFVSSQEIFDAVNELGIDYSQGFFIAKPRPDTKPDDFT
ncbi:EAL domain-containing protein [Geovibrio thiophilus]|uniref:EAL domain-containing protein n=1 Tax=Geovibrio thiophilus TaxID=139438 RepID=A0A410K012_9BACT|nr:EAL domain-containing protein [Geovibrio thiophilus]QAR33645.1 EAL domain-containing protein [Geovibrio thiophilus]